MRRSYLEFPTPDLLGTMVPATDPDTTDPDAAAVAVEAWADATVRGVLSASAPADAREALRDNLVEWASRAGAGAGGGRAVFLCLDPLRSRPMDGADPGGATTDATADVVAAYVSAVLQWDLLAEWDDVPTIDEVAGYLGRYQPDMLSLPEVEPVDHPGGPAVRVHVMRAPMPDSAAASENSERGETALVEECLTVGVVFPEAGAAMVTGTWPALHAGESMIELVTAVAAAMRVGVEGDGPEDDG